MLPIVLVLLVATSALAAPAVNIQQVSQNSILGPRDNTLTARALNIIDGGDTNVYILNIEETLKDLASKPAGKAQAFGQAIAVLGELATGRPGDSCAAAALIDAAASGNPGAIRGALGGYIRQVANNIDNIVQAVVNPQSARFSSGARGGCAGEGRTYAFDSAWDRIFSSVSPAQISLINEEYCTAKRLYNAFNVRSNNVAAQVTASALPSTVQVFNNASGALSSLLSALTSGGNPSQAASAAKQALINGVGRVSL